MGIFFRRSRAANSVVRGRIRPNFELMQALMYSAGEENSPLCIFLHDQLPFFLGETGRNSGKFLQEIQYFLQEILVFLPEILRFYL